MPSITKTRSCPPQQNNDLFTCGAFGNTDHNPSIRTAYDPLYRTAIYLIQLLTEAGHMKHEEIMIESDVRNKKTIAPFSVVYIMVYPVVAKA